jgi:hypothetical protein
MPPPRLVLDANILIRAVLGNTVLTLLDRYKDDFLFCTPEICFQDAHRNLYDIAVKRGLDLAELHGDLADLSASLFRYSNFAITSFSDLLQLPALPVATPTIGPSSPRRSSSTVQSGRKTETSSAAASRHGRPERSKSICGMAEAKQKRAPIAGGQSALVLSCESLFDDKVAAGICAQSATGTPEQGYAASGTRHKVNWISPASNIL